MSSGTKRARDEPCPAIDATRGRQLNTASVSRKDGPVLLVIDRDQRLEDNWAALHARNAAHDAGVPLVVAFAAHPPAGATLRAWSFLLGGLAAIESACNAKGIPFIVLHGPPESVVPAFAAQERAILVVVDFSPLREDRAWRVAAAARLAQLAPPVPCCEVDAHNVVPAWAASDRLEYAARTFRPRVMSKLPRYLVEYWAVAPQAVAWKPRAQPTGLLPPGPAGAATAAAGAAAAGGAAGALPEAPLRWSWQRIDWPGLLASLPLDRSVREVGWAAPGFDAGMAALADFVSGPEKRLATFHTLRNDPTLARKTAGLSPWLHFGQIAPARAALEAYRARDTSPSTLRPAVDAFIEELVVRRELSDNYCLNNPRYDDLDGLYPQFGNDSWAQKTLREHAGDKREYVYSEAQLTAGATHDPLWNAAQNEMVVAGKMHGFMRMYWAKKVLEWTASPRDALRIALALNDRFSLDGRDPNGYVGVAWSVAGVHDQGWAERPVFGKIRYMNYKGCTTKFKVPVYISAVKALQAAASKAAR